MTRKTLFIFATVVVAVFISFTSFAQEQGKEAAAKGSEKIVPPGDLQTQKKTMEGLKASYAQAKAEYEEMCSGKTYKSIEDYKKNYQKQCEDKTAQVTKIYNELKKTIEVYNTTVKQSNAANAQKAAEAADAQKGEQTGSPAPAEGK